MPFQKGQPKPANSGRKKGTKNRLRRVADALQAEGLEPVLEVIKLLRFGDMKDKDRGDLWMQLVSYCQARPKDFEGDDGGDDDDPDPLDGLTEAQLLKLVRPEGR